MAKSSGGQGVVLGYLKYVLGFDSLAFQEGLGDADKRLKAAQKSLKQTADKFTNIGARLSVGITAPFIAASAAAYKGAKDQAAAMAQVNAALSSMGPVADRTSKQLLKASDAMELRSLFDGDEILRKMTANMLTFGNVSGAQFDRAQQAALDLATRMGTDLQSATIMVGKALNDPIKGISALSRVGIQLSADQQELIRSMVAVGDTAGAQKIILGELERQFGGAAQAAASTDPMRRFNVVLGQIGDSLGEKVIPLLENFANAAAGFLDAFNQLTPAQQTFAIGAVALGAALGPVLIGIGAIVSAVGVLLPALTVLAGFMTATLIPVLIGVGKALIGLAIAGGPLTIVAAAVGAVYLAWQNWDKIGPILERLYTAAKKWLLDKLGAVFDWVKEKVTAVGDAFFNLYDRVVGHSFVPDMITEVGDWFAKLDGVMVNPAIDATAKTATAFADMASGVVNNFQSMLRALKSGDIGGFASGLSGILGTVGGLFGGGSSDASIIRNSPTLSSLTSGGDLPKLAGGGTIGGLSGIDRNVLSINGKAAAMVGRGETLTVTPNNDNRRGGTFHFDLRGAVMTQDLLNQMNQIGQASTFAAVGITESRGAQRARRRLG